MLYMRVLCPSNRITILVRMSLSSPICFDSNKNDQNGGINTFNPKSDHAMNKKNKKAIAYMDENGKITKLTADDFASVKEFQN